MLHIILAILKIVGILLAVLLLLVLLVVCSVLFVPLRYRVSAAKDAEGVRAQGRVSWLLRAVSATVELHDGKPGLKVRILFFKKNFLPDQGQPPDEKRKKRRKKAQKKPPKRQDKAVKTERKVPEKLQKGQTAAEPGKSSVPPKITEEDFLESTEENTKEEKPDTKEEKPEKRGGKLRALWNRIKELWEKLMAVPQKLRQFTERGRAAFQKISDWVSFLFSDMVKAVICRFKQHLLYLWRHLKPDRIRGELRYGFDDPSLTGQLTGLLYILLPVGCYEIRLQPDFENTLYEGELHIKGHIRLCHLAIVGWKVFRDKEFRKILKKFQA